MCTWITISKTSLFTTANLQHTKKNARWTKSSSLHSRSTPDEWTFRVFYVGDSNFFYIKCWTLGQNKTRVCCLHSKNCFRLSQRLHARSYCKGEPNSRCCATTNHRGRARRRPSPAAHQHNTFPQLTTSFNAFFLSLRPRRRCLADCHPHSPHASRFSRAAILRVFWQLLFSGLAQSLKNHSPNSSNIPWLAFSQHEVMPSNQCIDSLLLTPRGNANFRFDWSSGIVYQTKRPPQTESRVR